MKLLGVRCYGIIMLNKIQPREYSKGGGMESVLHILTVIRTCLARIGTTTVASWTRTTTILTTGGIVRTGSGSSCRNSLHFSPVFFWITGEFCFTSWPLQPPRFLPISSNFKESAIYLLLSMDFVSQMIIRSIFTASSFRMARRIYGSFSCGDIKLAAATTSMISINNESMRYPKELRWNFGKSL